MLIIYEIYFILKILETGSSSFVHALNKPGSCYRSGGNRQTVSFTHVMFWPWNIILFSCILVESQRHLLLWRVNLSTHTSMCGKNHIFFLCRMYLFCTCETCSICFWNMYIGKMYLFSLSVLDLQNKILYFMVCKYKISLMEYYCWAFAKHVICLILALD